MILLCGIPSESPMRMVQAALDRLGTPYVVFNQREALGCDMLLRVDAGCVGGKLHIGRNAYALEAFTGAYLRPMDDRELPELRGQPPDSPLRARVRMLHELLVRWSEIAPGRIVNRPAPMGSNMSKPYQAQLIRAHGFAVPETLITNDPDRVLDFREQQGRLVYKSISGVRSIVTELSDKDIDRLERIRWCPTQFQAYIDGFNVRVHTIGAAAFATKVESNYADYRYATRQEDGRTRLSSYDLDPHWVERCLALASGLGLDFAGIDLKLAPDGRVYCFEVNPCPAYSYYEEHTGQPIAAAVAAFLTG